MASPKQLSNYPALAKAFAENSIRVGAIALDREHAIEMAGELLVASGRSTPEYTESMIDAVAENGPYIVIAPGIALAHGRPSEAVLEVGLGGRLDAVNIVDPDVAVITTVDLDHQDYLGHDREAIGAEKAGILRAGKPCVLAEKDPPSSVLRRAYAIGAFAIRGHSDYLIDDLGAEGWRWREPGYEITLPSPGLEAPAQRGNAAAAIAALRALDLPVPDEALREGVRAARVPGRLQRLPGSPERVLDVAHNPQGARQLGDWLAAHPRPTVAVFSALADKDIAGIVGPVAAQVQAWHLGPITDAGPRGLAVEELARRVRAALPDAAIVPHPSLRAALAAAGEAIGPAGRVLVFGSFHTVAEALAAR